MDLIISSGPILFAVGISWMIFAILYKPKPVVNNYQFTIENKLAKRTQPLIPTPPRADVTPVNYYKDLEKKTPPKPPKIKAVVKKARENGKDFI